MKPFTLPRWRLSSCCGHEWGYAARQMRASGPSVGASRRDFLKGAALGVAALSALGGRAGDAIAQGRTYPPPPPATSPVDGLIDFHVHTAPDVFGRALVDDEEAALARERGMEAIVLKSHTALTADRAWLVRRHVPNMKVFGGVTLNGAAGGINAEAVRWMWRMQGGLGRVVWFPTFDANNHVTFLKEAPEGIKVVGADGKVLPAVREVLKVCAEQKLVVHTGHSSGAEALAIIEAARDAGCDRIAVTHAEFEVIGMSVDQMKKAASMGAKLEICTLGMLYGPSAHLAFLRTNKQIPAKESAAHIKEVGAEHFILSTDLGQTANPTSEHDLDVVVAVAHVAVDAEDALDVHRAFELGLHRAQLNAAVLRDGRDASGEAARKTREHELDGRRAAILGREDLGMIRLERELGAVLLLRAEPEEVLDERAAARALLPFAGGAPREFRRFGRLAQSFARLEQGAYVHTVVYRRRHGESPYWNAIRVPGIDRE